MAACNSQLRPLTLLTKHRSLVVDKLVESVVDESIGMAYIYLDYADRKAQTADSVISSLVKQLSLQRKSSDNVQQLYDDCKKGKCRPDADSLGATLRTICKHFKRVFLILDALDECEEKVRKSILSPLHGLDKSICRFFLTSRPHLSDLQRDFCGSPQIEIKANHSDIKLLIRKGIENNTMLSVLVEENEHLEETIGNEIVQHAKDM